MSEDLTQLTRAVAATVQQLELLDVGVRLDRQGGAVIAEGSGIANWGQRQRLEHALITARLRHETHIPKPTIVVYPS